MAKEKQVRDNLLVSEEHKVYAGEEDKIKNNNLSSKGFVVVAEENENNNLVLFINPEFKNLIFHNMDSPFTSEVISKGFVVIGVEDDFIDFVVKNLSQNRVFSSGFIYLFFTNSSKSKFVTHFDESNSLKNSSAELYTLPVSFKAFFNNLTCSGLGGNSSTGCQSICSQNSQSSSVTSPVCLYLLDMSCFKTSINAFPNNLDATLDWSSLGNCIFISSILTNNSENNDYLSFSIEKNLSGFKLQKITEVYDNLENLRENVCEIYGKLSKKLSKKVTIFSGMKGDKNFRSDEEILGGGGLKGKNLHEGEVGINNWAYRKLKGEE